MPASVAKIREAAGPEAETKVVPAIGVSIAVSIGGDRQLTIQTHFSQDEPVETGNQVIDRLRGYANRQKAFAEIDRLTDEISDHQVTLGDLERAVTKTEQEHNDRQGARKAEIALLREDAGKVSEAAYGKFVASGKRGEFELRGADKQRREVIAAQIVKIEEQMRAADADRAQWVNNNAINQQRYRTEIAIRETKLAAAKALIGEA